MKCVFEVVVRLISKTYEQQLHRAGHGLRDAYRLWSEPQFRSKERTVVENPTGNAAPSVSFYLRREGRSCCQRSSKAGVGSGESRLAATLPQRLQQ